MSERDYEFLVTVQVDGYIHRGTIERAKAMLGAEMNRFLADEGYTQARPILAISAKAVDIRPPLRGGYEHRALTHVERIGVATNAQYNREVSGVFLEGRLIAVVLDDSSGVGSGVAALMNAVSDLSYRGRA